MSDQRLELDFRSVREPDAGPRWRALFEEFWPAYERWFRRDGLSRRPSYLACRRAMHEHLPALVPAWEALVDLAGGGDVAARFLSQYRPPEIIAGCTQALWRRADEPGLVHNYDYAPRLCDGVVLLSAWTGPAVIATTDCLIGALDGMNEEGLAVALAFGGRPVVGAGFSAPLVLRAVLESCGTTEQAVASLSRVPVYMSYTFAVVDRAGRAATVFCAPDRPARVDDTPVSTNHQREVEWPRYAQATETVARAEHLRSQLDAGVESLDALAELFLAPPLFRRAYRQGSGTLYTLVCRTRLGCVEHRWHDGTWRHSLDDFQEQTRLVRYQEGTG